MARHIIFKMALPRILIALCLLGLVSACGSPGANTTQTTTTVSPGTTITPTTNPPSAQSPSLPPPNIGNATALDLAGLLHLDSYTVSCALGAAGYRNAVVLASNRLEYDAGEIQQMATYLRPSIRSDPTDTSNPPAPPATLNETTGSLTGTDPSKTACFSYIQITNIANSAIQITGVNMRLLSDAQLNQYQYRLIDACSLASLDASGINPLCPKLGGGGLLFQYNFNLNMAKADTVFSGQPEGTQPFLVDPGQVAFIFLDYLSSTNLIYSVAPEITVSQTGEQRTFTISQLTSSLAFAMPDQISCYQLHGNTFSQIDLNTTGTSCL
jgi:hypothetical protein